MKKTLGQISYEATGGPANFGTWAQAPRIVRELHEQGAQAVRRKVWAEIRTRLMNGPMHSCTYRAYAPCVACEFTKMAKALSRMPPRRSNPKVLPLAGLDASREQPVVGIPNSEEK